MRIDKAIELLDSMNEGWPMTNIEQYDKAIRLGIEALKRIKDERGESVGCLVNPLPGETEDPLSLDWKPDALANGIRTSFRRRK